MKEQIRRRTCAFLLDNYEGLFCPLYFKLQIKIIAKPDANSATHTKARSRLTDI